MTTCQRILENMPPEQYILVFDNLQIADLWAGRSVSTQWQEMVFLCLASRQIKLASGATHFSTLTSILRRAPKLNMVSIEITHSHRLAGMPDQFPPINSIVVGVGVDLQEVFKGIQPGYLRTLDIPTVDANVTHFLKNVQLDSLKVRGSPIKFSNSRWVLSL